MPSLLLVFFGAVAVAACLTPIVRVLALRFGVVALPGGRHIHGKGIPRLGGLAIAAAVVAPLVALAAMDTGLSVGIQEQSRLALGYLAGAALITAVGAWDDIRGLAASRKLVAQCVVACFAFWAGFRIDAVQVPWLFGEIQMGIFALPVTVLWIVGVTNAVNLIDGLDGLAAGVVFFAAATNLTLAVIYGSVLVAALMAALMGALVGFLFFNFNPARIFMGDSGSYFLGFSLATMSLAGALQKASTAVSLLVPLVALGLPIFDTAFSVLRRALERRSLFSPDRGHIHHRLLDMGLTHKRAVMLLYGVSLLLTVAALGIALGRSWQVGAGLILFAVVLSSLVRFAGYGSYVAERYRQRVGVYDEVTRQLMAALPPFIVRIAEARTANDCWQGANAALLGTGIEYVCVEFLVPPLRVPIAEGAADAQRSSQVHETHFSLGEQAAGTVRFKLPELPLSLPSRTLLDLFGRVIATEIAKHSIVVAEAAIAASERESTLLV